MKIRTQLLLPVSVALVATCAVGYFGISYATSRLVQRNLETAVRLKNEAVTRSADAKVRDVYSIIDRFGRQALEQAAFFSRMDEVRHSYELALSGDVNDENDPNGQQAREKLRGVFRPIIDGYKANSGQSEFTLHFHLPNGRSLARLWRDGWQTKRDGKKVDISDDISAFRKTVMEINGGNHKPISGIEVGSAGFAIRGLAPVTAADGRHLGSNEMLVSFDAVVEASRTSGDFNFAVYMNHDQLHLATALQDADKYPVLDNKYVFCASTDSAVTNSLVTAALLDAGANGKTSVENGNFYITAFPIPDYSGNTVGVMVAVRDISNWQGMLASIKEDGAATLASLRIGSGLGMAALVLLIGGIIAFVSQRVVKHLQRAIGVVEKVSVGDTSVAGNNKPTQGRANNELEELDAIIAAMACNLGEREKHAMAIAQGDLTRDVVLASERDGLGKALQVMTANLRDIISQIQCSSDQIDSGSGQVAAASQSLSQGATEQASSLEEISASMNQMATQTKLNAENAAQANQLSNQAQNAAERGNSQMQQMVRAMGEISHSSQSISRIIKTIDEIAFQTNLLALNAAVEAARAGQHGKGFAVVAEEVRNLAARSAKAARETAELIEGSVSKTENGAKISEATAFALGEILSGVTHVSGLLKDISGASNEQAQGFSEISQGLGRIDLVTQQNTATAEESAAAAEELSGQSSQLKEMLLRFRLPGHGLRVAASEAPRQRPADHIRIATAGSTTWPAQANGLKAKQGINLDDEEFGRY